MGIERIMFQRAGSGLLTLWAVLAVLAVLVVLVVPIDGATVRAFFTAFVGESRLCVLVLGELGSDFEPVLEKACSIIVL